MEFGMRELLFFIGLVFIAGILFDGLRRMRKSKGELYGLPPDYDQIEIGRNGPDDSQFHKVGQSADVIDLRSDAQRAGGNLSTGLEKGRGADEMVQQERATAAVVSGSNTGPTSSAHTASEQAYGERTSVDPVEQTSVEQTKAQSAGPQQVFEDDYYNDELPNGGARRVETSKVESSASDAYSVSTPTTSVEKNEPTVFLDGVMLDESGSNGLVHETVNDEITDETVEEPTLDDESLGVQGTQAPSDVIIFNIVAKDKGTFSGQSLLKAVEMCQMTLGDMNIFHRYEGNPRESLFSMANLVEPGTFDLDTMHDFKSPGVCLFMQLPGPKRSIVALERMVEVARKLAIKLGAEMRDENHSVITPQTIEHYRQRVMEFERKRRTRQYAEMAH